MKEKIRFAVTASILFAIAVAMFFYHGRASYCIGENDIYDRAAQLVETLFDRTKCLAIKRVGP